MIRTVEEKLRLESVCWLNLLLRKALIRKCTPRESFKTHAEKKLAKIERFFGEEAEAKITATVEKSAKIVVEDRIMA